MPAAAHRRPAARPIGLDRALEALPLFRLSDSSSEEASVVFSPEPGRRWRVIPAPGDRLPGTFDQDVYVELMRRFHDLGAPGDGVIAFTLHDFLRSMGRQVDGRTYEQLRAALGRLHRTTLESTGVYWDGAANHGMVGQFSLLASSRVERRRATDREQLGLFPVLPANEPGDARVTLAAPVRANIAAGFTAMIVPARYLALSSPVSRRLYRLLAAVAAGGEPAWTVPLVALAERLPLAQRYPSHLQRVLQPAHEMLITSGLVRQARLRPDGREWLAEYTFEPLRG